MKKAGMRRGWLVAVSAAAILIAANNDAHAGYGQQGFFTGRVKPDGSIDLRNQVVSGNGAVAGQSIAQRPRPEFDPAPIDIGSFQLFPSITAGVAYDSNIYSQLNGAKSDYVWTLSPGVQLLSNWNRHSLSLGMQGDFGFYSNFPRESYHNGLINLNGRFDLANRTYIDYGIDLQRLSEERGATDSPASATEPATFNYMRTFAGFLRKQGRVDLRAQYAYRLFDYNKLTTGLGSVSQDTRNKEIHQVTTELGYEVMRYWRPFVRAGYNWRDFEKNSFHASQGSEVVVGTGYELGGGTVTGEIYAGYMNQDFTNWAGNGQAKNTGDFKFGGNFLWNVSGLTSVIGEMDRTLEDTTSTGYRSFISTGGSLTLQHELRRNILLEAKGGYTRYDFNGAPERQDHNYNAGAGVRYFFNRNFYSDLQYNYRDLVSSTGSNNYDRHVVQLRFGAQM